MIDPEKLKKDAIIRRKIADRNAKEKANEQQENKKSRDNYRNILTLADGKKWINKKKNGEIIPENIARQLAFETSDEVLIALWEHNFERGLTNLSQTAVSLLLALTQEK